MIQLILIFLGVSVIGFFALAVGLILSQRPLAVLAGMPEDEIQAAATATSDMAPVAVSKARLRDGFEIDVRQLSANGIDPPLLILLHGSGWYGQQFDALLPALAKHADVIAPDLRGHGPQAKLRGDVAYIGQLEDDIADLIALYARPEQKIVLAGHSSGGGLAIRFLAGARGDRVTSAILLAPFLKYNAPTMRPNAGGWSRPLVRRFIGLSLLNAVGVTVLNHLTVLQFAFPEFVLNTAHKVALTRSYTYRMNLSYEPRSDYLSDIAALPRFDLIVGQDDKFFIADAFKPLMRAVTDKGQYHMIQTRGHLNLLYAPETLQIIKRHLATG